LQKLVEAYRRGVLVEQARADDLRFSTFLRFLPVGSDSGRGECEKVENADTPSR